MSDPKQTLETDPGANTEGGQDADVEATVPSHTDSADAQKQADAIALERINAITGRDSKTLEEAEKHLAHLNKLVGDNTIAELRKKGDFTDKVLRSVMREQKLANEEEAKSFLEKLMSDEPVTSVPQTTKLDPVLEAKLQAGERAEFLLDNPEARPYLPKIQEYARVTGKTLKDSFEFLYGDIKKEQQDKTKADELKREKRGAQATVTTGTPPIPKDDKINELLKKYRKDGSSDTFRDVLKERWKRRLAPKEE